MSLGTILLAVGVVLLVVGLAKIGTGQSGGFNNVLKNFGIKFGGSITQVTDKATSVRRAPTAKRSSIGAA